MYEPEYETHKLNWQNISLTVEFCKSWSPAFRKVQGFDMSHLSIKRDDKGQLPISETGEKSLFIGFPHIEEHGTAEKYVKAWLDHDASSKEWKKYEAESKQLKLF